MKIKNKWWTCTFYPFYNFRTSKDLEILRQSSYMSHILKSKRNTHIPHIVLYDEERWQKMCSNAYFGVFMGGGHFWRVTLVRVVQIDRARSRNFIRKTYLPSIRFSRFAPYNIQNMSFHSDFSSLPKQKCAYVDGLFISDHNKLPLPRSSIIWEITVCCIFNNYLLDILELKK